MAGAVNPIWTLLCCNEMGFNHGEGKNNTKKQTTPAIAIIVVWHFSLLRVIERFSQMEQHLLAWRPHKKQQKQCAGVRTLAHLKTLVGPIVLQLAWLDFTSIHFFKWMKILWKKKRKERYNLTTPFTSWGSLFFFGKIDY